MTAPAHSICKHCHLEIRLTVNPGTAWTWEHLTSGERQCAGGGTVAEPEEGE